jgi:hypothetical protein
MIFAQYGTSLPDIYGLTRRLALVGQLSGRIGLSQSHPLSLKGEKRGGYIRIGCLTLLGKCRRLSVYAFAASVASNERCSITAAFSEALGRIAESEASIWITGTWSISLILSSLMHPFVPYKRRAAVFSGTSTRRVMFAVACCHSILVLRISSHSLCVCDSTLGQISLLVHTNLEK